MSWVVFSERRATYSELSSENSPAKAISTRRQPFASFRPPKKIQTPVLEPAADGESDEA